MLQLIILTIIDDIKFKFGFKFEGVIRVLVDDLRFVIVDLLVCLVKEVIKFLKSNSRLSQFTYITKLICFGRARQRPVVLGEER